MFFLIVVKSFSLKTILLSEVCKQTGSDKFVYNFQCLKRKYSLKVFAPTFPLRTRSPSKVGK